MPMLSHLIFYANLLDAKNSTTTQSTTITRIFIMTRIPLLRPLYCALLATTLAGLAGCYDPSGETPEARKTKETKLWTDDQIDAVAEMTYISIDGGEPVTGKGVPAACNK